MSESKKFEVWESDNRIERRMLYGKMGSQYERAVNSGLKVFGMRHFPGLLQPRNSMWKPEVLPSGESWSDGEELWGCQSSVGWFALLILFLCGWEASRDSCPCSQ